MCLAHTNQINEWGCWVGAACQSNRRLPTKHCGGMPHNHPCTMFLPSSSARAGVSSLGLVGQTRFLTPTLLLDPRNHLRRLLRHHLAVLLDLVVCRAARQVTVLEIKQVPGD